jgi:hypothetical protein
MGAPQTIYNGGLLRAMVRYFDMERVRSGLPENVAALVESIEANCIVVNLVNLDALNTHKLIVQAGAFGEHEFTEVTFRGQPEKDDKKATLNNQRLSINKKYFAVELLPATSIQLNIGIRRFVNKPSYAFPWQGENVPER